MHSSTRTRPFALLVQLLCAGICVFSTACQSSQRAASTEPEPVTSTPQDAHVAPEERAGRDAPPHTPPDAPPDIEEEIVDETTQNSPPAAATPPPAQASVRPNEPRPSDARGDAAGAKGVKILVEADAGRPADVRTTISPPATLEIATHNVRRLRLDRRALPLARDRSTILRIDDQAIEWTTKHDLLVLEQSRGGQWNIVERGAPRP
jgi:hypothetical protein